MRSIKCVIVGDGAVGKTSLLISYTTNTFPQDYIPTVFDNYSTTIALADPSDLSAEQEVFKLNLWDTAGQEEYDRLRPLSYPQTDIFIICFSVNEPSSFENVIDKWFPEIRHNTNYENMELFSSCGKFPILLVGTKADLREDEHELDRLRELNSDFVDRHEIDHAVSKCGFMGYVECSAATQFGVREVFERAVECVVYEPDRLLNRNKPTDAPQAAAQQSVSAAQTKSQQPQQKAPVKSTVTSSFTSNKVNKRKKKSKCVIL